MSANLCSFKNVQVNSEKEPTEKKKYITTTKIKNIIKMK